MYYLFMLNKIADNCLDDIVVKLMNTNLELIGGIVLVKLEC